MEHTVTGAHSLPCLSGTPGGNAKKLVYTVGELANLVGKSANLIYRRLTEKEPRYVVRFARREGDRWVFDKNQVDSAIQKGESIIIKRTSPKIIDSATALRYLNRRSRSCGKEVSDETEKTAG